MLGQADHVREEVGSAGRVGVAPVQRRSRPARDARPGSFTGRGRNVSEACRLVVVEQVEELPVVGPRPGGRATTVKVESPRSSAEALEAGELGRSSGEGAARAVGVTEGGSLDEAAVSVIRRGRREPRPARERGVAGRGR